MPTRPARSTPPAIPLEGRLSYRCAMISTRIARFLGPMWETRYGLGVDTWRILAIIGRFGPLSAKEVATRSSNDAFHVSRAIERLARKKLIRRDVDPQDRRRARLALTAAGRAAHDAIEQALTRLESELLAGLKESERETLRSALSVVDERALALMASGLTWKDFAD